MLAIAISALLFSIAGLAGWAIVTSLKRGWAIGRDIVAELANLQQVQTGSSPAFRPLRGRSPITPQGYSRQPVRLRPLRRACAAA